MIWVTFRGRAAAERGVTTRNTEARCAPTPLSESCTRAVASSTSSKLLTLRSIRASSSPSRLGRVLALLPSNSLSQNPTERGWSGPRSRPLRLEGAPPVRLTNAPIPQTHSATTARPAATFCHAGRAFQVAIHSPTELRCGESIAALHPVFRGHRRTRTTMGERAVQVMPPSSTLAGDSPPGSFSPADVVRGVPMSLAGRWA